MNRRQWLASSLGMAALPAILEAQQHAHDAVRLGTAPAFFDKQAALDVEALTSEIVPTTSTPGAKEAGVVHFIDRALTSFDREKQAAYRDGLAAINVRRIQMYPESATCASLTSGQRIALLKSVETTPFFDILRTHTMLGFLADPIYGSNPAGGYRTLGLEPAHVYNPPFGWYDDKVNGGEN